jgi:hypothetical protein
MWMRPPIFKSEIRTNEGGFNGGRFAYRPYTGLSPPSSVLIFLAVHEAGLNV